MRARITDHCNCQARSRAFTLVEILMVVIIVGIAAAVVMPQISQRDDMKAASASRIIMADLLYAQNMAITRQAAHYLVFDVANHNYMVVKTGAMTTAIAHPVNHSSFIEHFGAGGDPGLKEATLLSAAFLGATTTPYATIGFDELGTPLVYTGGGSDESMTSGAIVVQSGNYKLQVSVEPYTGQLSVTQIP